MIEGRRLPVLGQMTGQAVPVVLPCRVIGFFYAAIIRFMASEAIGGCSTVSFHMAIGTGERQVRRRLHE